MLYIPQFQQVFISSGAELPGLTILFINNSMMFWSLPILVVAARLFWPARHRRGSMACLIGVIGMVLVVSATIVAMRLPVSASGM